MKVIRRSIHLWGSVAGVHPPDHPHPSLAAWRGCHNTVAGPAVKATPEELDAVVASQIYEYFNEFSCNWALELIVSDTLICSRLLLLHLRYDLLGPGGGGTWLITQGEAFNLLSPSRGLYSTSAIKYGIGDTGGGSPGLHLVGVRACWRGTECDYWARPWQQDTRQKTRSMPKGLHDSNCV